MLKRQRSKLKHYK